MSNRKTLGKDEEIKLLYDYGIHIPSRTIVVESVQANGDEESGVDAHMWSRLHKGLHILEQWPLPSEADPTITIDMNNIGGDAYHMFAMYDCIKSSRCNIVMKVSGHVMSAGSIILQAADTRLMHPHATMMIHHGVESYTGHAKDFQRHAAENKRVEELMYDIYLERMREKNPKFSRRMLKEKMAFDYFISAPEAVKIGLADDIIPPFVAP